METLSKLETQRLREKYIGKSVYLFYSDEPLKIMRALGQYMFDENGTRYLDCINNVCHVGHCHPKVVKAASDQMATLNTNARFLHDNMVILAKRLTATLPADLSVCFFCNSGSEATDLALQLAREHTKASVMLTLDRAYHGHIASALSVSPYKFKHRKDFEQFTETEVVPCPDVYRGKYQQTDHPDIDLSLKYAEDVQSSIEKIKAGGKQVAGLIAESMQSCGGQVVYPPNYLKHVYKYVRSAGGVCIADEVQVGFGRMGTCFWAFQTQGVTPDIVTIGKPMGNGHPIAAVITTPAISDSFSKTGLTYFNTFGGNPVSCAVALAVLDIMDEEKLMDNCIKVGRYLKDQLESLKSEFPIVGNIRGQGMFLGIDLVRDRNTKEPATEEAKYIVFRMKQEHILISYDGNHDNVIKFKPPLCFNIENADHLVKKLRDMFHEVHEMRLKQDGDGNDNIIEPHEQYIVAKRTSPNELDSISSSKIMLNVGYNQTTSSKRLRSS